MPAPTPLRRLLRSRPLLSLLADRSASTAIEFSLVLPAIVGIITGIVEVGQAMWTQMALNSAVQSAARCASISPQTCGTPAQVQAYASQHAGGMTLPAGSFTFTQPACGMQVTANFAFTPFTSYIPMSFRLTATSCFPNWANANNA